MPGFDLFFPESQEVVSFKSLDEKISRDALLDELFKTAKVAAEQLAKKKLPWEPSHDGYQVLLAGRLTHGGKTEKWAYTRNGELCLMNWPDYWARFL